MIRNFGNAPRGIGVEGKLYRICNQLNQPRYKNFIALNKLWPKILGNPALAEHTEPLSTQDFILTVLCEDSAAATFIKLKSKNIIAAINKEIPGITVEKVETKIGPLYRN